MLDTMTDTAASTPPAKKEENHTGELELGQLYQRNCVVVPKIASIAPGLSITRTACATDAIVVAIDTEKIPNKRYRNAGTRTPLTIWIHG